MNYFELLKMQAEKHPDKTFLILDDQEYSYGEIWEKSQDLSKAMEDISGIQFIRQEDFLGQTLLFFAVEGAGGIPVILHSGMTDETVEELVQKNSVQGILWLQDGKIASKKFLSDGREIHEAKEDLSHVCMGALSSGSTGIPKLLYRTYESWADFFPVQNKIFEVKDSSRFFLQGSLGFTGNLNFFLAVLYEGGTVVTSDRMLVRTWGRLISMWKADVLYLVPSKLRLLMAGFCEKLPSVKMILAGSQTLSKKDLRAIHEKLERSRLILYYGASELSFITYIECDGINKNPADLGVPFPGISVKIGQDNLIYVDTPYGIQGAPRPCTVGDTGELDEQGHLLFYGRSQDWVNKCGYKISCTKIENRLREIPGVEDAVVLPVTDELRGQELAAFLVLAQDGCEKDVRKAIKDSFSNVEIPGHVCFIPEMPLNDRGKTDKERLLKYMSEK